MNILLFLGGVELMTLIFSAGIFLLIFIALRAVMLWYWKVDKILQHLEMQTRIAGETRDLIRKLVNGPSVPLTDAEKAKAYDALK